ncbi:MAG: hypothetical protein OXQ29_24220, partial [Rhodospirillaceae bacterium]|nr:hypothetical protein [Rhodospirillaceae bacterium]
MKRLLALLMVMGLIAAACGNDDDDAAPLNELNVAYFLEWPTANQVAQAEQTYDDVLGLTVNWIPFASGGDMAQAMESGDIDISYSQGLTPFANFVTGGSDLLLIGVAVSYADADNCVAHLTGFLQVTEDANRAYNENRAPFIDTIAEAAGMDRAPTIALLDAFSFPEKDMQLSQAWLGGTVQQVMKDQMDFFVAQGEIASALPSYD